MGYVYNERGRMRQGAREKHPHTKRPVDISGTADRNAVPWWRSSVPLGVTGQLACADSMAHRSNNWLARWIARWLDEAREERLRGPFRMLSRALFAAAHC